MHHEHPELIKDQYWDEVLPAELPYTVASEPFREEHPQPSTANMDIPAAGTTLSFNSTLKLDEMAMAEHMHIVSSFLHTYYLYFFKLKNSVFHQ